LEEKKKKNCRRTVVNGADLDSRHRTHGQLMVLSQSIFTDVLAIIVRGSLSGIMLGPFSMRWRCTMTIAFTPPLVNTRWGLRHRTDRPLDPLDQLALASILKGSQGDGKLLAPRKPFS
jgi:hypothetical protein